MRLTNTILRLNCPRRLWLRRLTPQPLTSEYVMISFEQAMEMVDNLVDGRWDDQIAVERAYRRIKDLENDGEVLPLDKALNRLLDEFNSGHYVRA